MRLLLVSILAMSVCVAGAPAPAGIAPETEPHWLKQPTPSEVAAVFPLTAARLGHGGWARLGCTVLPDGGLARCEVLAEDPADEGFADAALKLAKLYKLASPGGSTMPRTTIELPIRFSLAP